jgi:hypothetical protein
VAPDVADEADMRLAMELGLAVSSTSGAPTAPGTLTRALTRLPNVDAAVMFHIQQNADQHLRPTAAAGAAAAQLEQLAIPVGERLTGWVAATQQPMVNADAALDLFDVPGGPFRSAVSVPCTLSCGSRAVVTLYSATVTAFSESHVRLLTVATTLLGTRSGRQDPQNTTMAAGKAAIPTTVEGNPNGDSTIDPMCDRTSTSGTDVLNSFNPPNLQRSSMLH